MIRRRRLNENVTLLTNTSFKKLLTPSVKQKLEKMAMDVDYVLKKRGGLDSRDNDYDDFVEIPVWVIETMLQEAYLMGRLSNKE